MEETPGLIDVGEMMMIWYIISAPFLKIPSMKTIKTYATPPKKKKIPGKHRLFLGNCDWLIVGVSKLMETSLAMAVGQLETENLQVC